MIFKVPEELIEATVARRIAERLNDLQAKTPNADQITDLVAGIVDAAVERQLADAIKQAKGEIAKSLPSWLQNAKPFPMTFDEMGRLFADDHKDDYRFGPYRDDPTPCWRWSRGSSTCRWVPVDTRVIRDAVRDFRQKLAERAGEDCPPSEAVRRLHFIEVTCKSAVAASRLLEVAGEILGAPQEEAPAAVGRVL